VLPRSSVCYLGLTEGTCQGHAPTIKHTSTCAPQHLPAQSVFPKLEGDPHPPKGSGQTPRLQRVLASTRKGKLSDSRASCCPHSTPHAASHISSMAVAATLRRWRPLSPAEFQDLSADTLKFERPSKTLEVTRERKT
jgi:hypothetical protein